MPEPILLLARQFVVGFEYGESLVAVAADKLFEPFAHFFAAPAHHGAVVKANRRVGHHQVFVDTHDAAETFAAFASAEGRVERKHIVIGFAEGHAVGLKADAEIVQNACRIKAQAAFAIAFEKGGLHRIGHSRQRIFVSVYRQAVDEQKDASSGCCFCCVLGSKNCSFVGLKHLSGALQIILDAHHFAVDVES